MKQRKLYNTIHESANLQKFAKIAKVTDVHSGGLYSVELGGGQVISKLNSVSYGSKFYEGQWVTIEYFGGDWVISGESAQRGGD